MVECEVCGKPATTKALIEGVKLSACNKCVHMGEEIIERQQVAEKKEITELKTIDLIDDFGGAIKKKRESMKLSWQDLARKLLVHESELKRIEENKLKPDEKTAAKIERELGINLFKKQDSDDKDEQDDEEEQAAVARKSKPRVEFTLADVAVIKRK